MFGKKTLQFVLGFWALWHLAFGLLATLAPETGARITGWSPQAGWSADLLAMSTQYGMVMLVLAAVYVIMVFDPIRHLNFLWVAVGEQGLGIAYAVYIYAVIGTVTAPQLVLQSVINLAFITMFVVFWVRLRSHSATVPA